MTESFHTEQVELVLYADNESALYPQKKRIIANMKERIEKGTYDPELAVVGWQHWVDEAAKRYVKEFKVDMVKTFPIQCRRAAAKEIAEREAEAIKSGEYGALEVKAGTAPKTKASAKVGAKYHTKYMGPTDTRGSRIVVKTLSTGKHKSIPYDHSARDAHESALRSAIANTTVKLTGHDDGKGGKWWHVNGNGKGNGKATSEKFLAGYGPVHNVGTKKPFATLTDAKTWAREHAQKVAERYGYETQWIVWNNATGESVASGKHKPKSATKKAVKRRAR